MDDSGKFKSHPDYCSVLLLYFDIVIFEKKSIGIKIYVIMAACRSNYGTCRSFSGNFVSFYEVFGNSRHYERIVYSVHRIYCVHFNGVNIYCIKADDENQIYDTGNCHVGEKSPGFGKRQGRKVNGFL